MDWLNEAWRFIESEENREILAFVGVGIAAVVIAGWQVYTHFAQPWFLRASFSGGHGQRGRRGQRRRHPYHANLTGNPHRRRCARYFTAGLSKGLG